MRTPPPSPSPQKRALSYSSDLTSYKREEPTNIEPFDEDEKIAKVDSSSMYIGLEL